MNSRSEKLIFMLFKIKNIISKIIFIIRLVNTKMFSK